MERAYPVLSEALENQALADDPEQDHGDALSLEPEAQATVRKGVQGAIGGSGAYIDAIVQQQAAGQRLKRFKPAKNVKPS
jgi:hypothetical protein